MTEPGGADTTDLRAGAPIHDDLLSVLPLVGEWAGAGRGVVAATGEQFRYGQRLRFAHDGRPFLAYESRSWLLDEDGGIIRNALREIGFWRLGASEDELEVTLVTITGIVEVFAGVAGDLRWELVTSAVLGTPTARDVAGEHRFYALRGDELTYVTELAVRAGEFHPHLNATLRRV